MKAVSMAPSMIGWATWMPLGPSSLAMLWARARRANLAPAKALQPLPPRREAVAPATMMVPRPQGGHFPDLAIDPLGGFGNAEAHVGADIEHRHFDGAYVPLDMLEQLDHGLLAPCIAAEGVGSTTFVLDSRHQRFKLVRLPAGDAEGVPLPGEAAGDGAAGGLARTYDHGYWGSGH